jgi:hypothetical protein
VDRVCAEARKRTGNKLDGLSSSEDETEDDDDDAESQGTERYEEAGSD